MSRLNGVGPNHPLNQQKRQLSIPVDQVIANLQQQFRQAEDQRVQLAVALQMFIEKFGEKIRDDETATVFRLTLTDDESHRLNKPNRLISFTPDHSVPGVHMDVIDNHAPVEAEIIEAE